MKLSCEASNTLGDGSVHVELIDVEGVRVRLTSQDRRVGFFFKPGQVYVLLPEHLLPKKEEETITPADIGEVPKALLGHDTVVGGGGETSPDNTFQ